MLSETGGKTVLVAGLSYRGRHLAELCIIVMWEVELVRGELGNITAGNSKKV